MFVRIINSYRKIVAICDSDLLGKKFEYKNSQLYIKKSFYEGKNVSEGELREIIKKMLLDDAIFNIVGKKSISIALDTGVILKDGIKKIQGVPFAFKLI